MFLPRQLDRTRRGEGLGRSEPREYYYLRYPKSYTKKPKLPSYSANFVDLAKTQDHALLQGVQLPLAKGVLLVESLRLAFSASLRGDV